MRALQTIPVCATVIAASLSVQAIEPVELSDFSDGANLWNLDSINVTDVDGGRKVAYDGDGVYIAVIDAGLDHNWRAYFPEERIDTIHARAFSGGGGERGTVSEQTQTWEHDTVGHGTQSASIILGFKYSGTENIPTIFNGVAPKATIIPIKAAHNSGSGWWSQLARALDYVTNLKISGELGDAPLVINISLRGGAADSLDPRVAAAIDYAVANGIIVVAAGGNEGDAGMSPTAAYPPVISVANAGWVEQFPADATVVDWIVRDVVEDDVAQYFIAPNSSRGLLAQDLDVTGPGFAIPGAHTINGQVDHDFGVGTTFATAHVSGIVALMLQKNPTLTAFQIEAILENTAMPLPPACLDVTLPAEGPGNRPSWSDLDNVSFFDATVCWEANSSGHGLVQADAALTATPLP